MSWLSKLFAASYDAAEDYGRRKSVSRTTYSEDAVATERKRKILSANARDLARNFSIARWAISKHLDYVSSFSFAAKTGDEGLDAAIEDYVSRQSTKDRFDVARRHPLRRATRIAEAMRALEGDVFWLKLAPRAPSLLRGKIQAIEGDRIISPKKPGVRDEGWINGVLLGKGGSALKYAVHSRGPDGTGLELEKAVSAANVLHHAWWDFRYDQVRGISPISASLNWFRDTYEGLEYGLAKLKVGQLFGLVISRDGESGPWGPDAPSATTDSDGDDALDSQHKVDMGRGPFQLDLDPGEAASVLEAKTPSAETVDFLKLMIHIALRSLDIPYSFFDESFSTFYGSRGGLIQYLLSCKTKREDVAELLNAWTRWRLGIAIFDGEIKLPAGKDFKDVTWEWIPIGVPWWDPAKEVAGHTAAIAAGLDSPQHVARVTGTDFYKNVDEIAAARDYAVERGVTLDLGASSVQVPIPVEVQGD
jgi:capsid protein